MELLVPEVAGSSPSPQHRRKRTRKFRFLTLTTAPMHRQPLPALPRGRCRGTSAWGGEGDGPAPGSLPAAWLPSAARLSGGLLGTPQQLAGGADGPSNVPRTSNSTTFCSINERPGTC